MGGGMSRWREGGWREGGWRDEWVEGWDICYSYDVNICTQKMGQLLIPLMKPLLIPVKNSYI